jgi:hypothetical protein
MNVQLKQSEIIEALKQFIAKQGINLSGKEVTITFTAGRKESGITADLVIEDAGIPGYTDADVEEDGTAADKPASLKVVPPNPELKAEAESEAEVKEPESETEVPVAKTTSLFS